MLMSPQKGVLAAKSPCSTSQDGVGWPLLLSGADQSCGVAVFHPVFHRVFTHLCNFTFPYFAWTSRRLAAALQSSQKHEPRLCSWAASELDLGSLAHRQWNPWWGGRGGDRER